MSSLNNTIYIRKEKLFDQTGSHFPRNSFLIIYSLREKRKKVIRGSFSEIHFIYKRPTCSQSYNIISIQFRTSFDEKIHPRKCISQKCLFKEEKSFHTYLIDTCNVVSQFILNIIFNIMPLSMLHQYRFFPFKKNQMKFMCTHLKSNKSQFECNKWVIYCHHDKLID